MTSYGFRMPIRIQHCRPSSDGRTCFQLATVMSTRLDANLLRADSESFVLAHFLQTIGAKQRS